MQMVDPEGLDTIKKQRIIEYFSIPGFLNVGRLEAVGKEMEAKETELRERDLQEIRELDAGMSASGSFHDVT